MELLGGVTSNQKSKFSIGRLFFHLRGMWWSYVPPQIDWATGKLLATFFPHT